MEDGNTHRMNDNTCRINELEYRLISLSEAVLPRVDKLEKGVAEQKRDNTRRMNELESMLIRLERDRIEDLVNGVTRVQNGHDRLAESVDRLKQRLADLESDAQKHDDRTDAFEGMVESTVNRVAALQKSHNALTETVEDIQQDGSEGAQSLYSALSARIEKLEDVGKPPPKAWPVFDDGVFDSVEWDAIRKLHSAWLNSGFDELTLVVSADFFKSGRTWHTSPRTHLLVWDDPELRVVELHVVEDDRLPEQQFYVRPQTEKDLKG